MSVDTYASQHPGGAHPDKSIAIHLVGLYLVLERQVPTAEMPRRHKYLADAVRAWAGSVWAAWSDHHAAIEDFARRPSVLASA